MGSKRVRDGLVTEPQQYADILFHYRLLQDIGDSSLCSTVNLCCFLHSEKAWHPLQCSCLENPMGGGAWWAAVHGVARSRTRLSDFTFTFHFHALEKEMAAHSIFLPGESQGQRSLAGYCPKGRKESDTTERLHFHFSLSCTGEGNGNPLHILAWRIPGTGEPGGLLSMGLHRVGHD